MHRRNKAKWLAGLLIGLSWWWLPMETKAEISVPISQDFNYQKFTSKYISRNFNSDPRVEAATDGVDVAAMIGPAPSCDVNAGSPEIEIFLINKDYCVIEGDSITYRVYIRNVGTGPAYNLKITFDAPDGAKIINNDLPDDYVGAQVGEFLNDPLYAFNAGQELDLTVTVTFVEAIAPATAKVTASFYSCANLHDKYRCMEKCIPNCYEECEKEYDICIEDCEEIEDEDTEGELSGGEIVNLPGTYIRPCPPIRPGTLPEGWEWLDDPNTLPEYWCYLEAPDGTSGKESCKAQCEDNLEECKENCFDSCKSKCDNAQKTVTTHIIPSNDCSAPDVSSAPLASKQPAIICGPGEVGCVDSIPDLGNRFDVATPWYEAMKLGKRFLEAIAVILPGECSVLADDVVSDPSFQDAFLREDDPAAPYMKPLWQSGRNFSTLVHENELLGIKNKIAAKEKLREIYYDHAQSVIDTLGAVLDGNKDTDAARQELTQAYSNWQQQTESAQKELANNYAEMQTDRKEKFDPVARAAIANAKESIGIACPGEANDGGLEASLVAVKQAYEENLDNRTTTYTQTQLSFLTFTGEDNTSGPDEWQNLANQALDQFDNDDKEPLNNLIILMPERWRLGFNAVWRATYETQADDDKSADDKIRLEYWEVALDAPKTVATDCMEATEFAAAVETTWCESNGYPEFVLKGEGGNAPAKAGVIAPPEYVSGGENTVIEDAAVSGTPCGGEPGDPYWATDCSCHCGEVVSSGGGVATCGSGQPITKLDMYVTSTEECLLDTRHTEPWL